MSHLCSCPCKYCSNYQSVSHKCYVKKTNNNRQTILAGFGLILFGKDVSSDYSLRAVFPAGWVFFRTPDFFGAPKNSLFLRSVKSSKNHSVVGPGSGRSITTINERSQEKYLSIGKPWPKFVWKKYVRVPPYVFFGGAKNSNNFDRLDFHRVSSLSAKDQHMWIWASHHQTFWRYDEICSGPWEFQRL